MVVVSFSIIVPTWQEASAIAVSLQALQPLRKRAEIIVVDGGSEDATCDLAQALADRVLTAPRGRALQMNAGARFAQGEILIFLHADTRLPADALEQIEAGFSQGHRWGRFDVGLDGHHPWLPAIAFLMNLRSRLSGIATGDQAIFVPRELFDQIGGFPDQPLMEDIELSRRLRRHGRPACLSCRVRTSARRWETQGVTKTILLMWWLRLRYFFGTKPDKLAAAYQTGRFL